MKQKWLEIRRGCIIGQKWSWHKGRLVRPPHRSKEVMNVSCYPKAKWINFNLEMFWGFAPLKVILLFKGHLLWQ
jgi:hypothetical protein